MFPIYKREMRAYFISPIGYTFIAVFLAVSGGLFSLTTAWMETADVATYFTFMIFMFTVLIPLLTMKLFSEERKTKTEQILLTSPVSLFGIVIAKFLAAFTLYAATMTLSCLINYSVLTSVSGKSPVFSQFFGNFIGILFLGAAFIAVGVFMSAITENQVVSAVATFGVILLMMVVNFVISLIGNAFIRSILKWFSVVDRYTFFTRGIFSLPAIIYFVSLVIIFLFLTARVYEMRRWN